MKRVIIFSVAFIGLATLTLSQRQGGSAHLKVIQLQEPKLKGLVSLEEALAKRRSIRSFDDRKLDYVQIGQLAWAAQGITESGTGFRTAPSAGAIYPIELYFATQDGIFVYRPDQHTLEEILSEDAFFPITRTHLIQDQGWKVFDVTTTQRMHVSKILKLLPSQTFSSLEEVSRALNTVIHNNYPTIHF